MERITKFAGAAVMLLLCLYGVACSSGSSKSDPNAQQIAVSLTSDGCAPAALDAKAGPATFTVTNKNASNVSEFEVKSGGRIVGEVENVSPGLTKKFTMTLKSGSYEIDCPGGKKDAKGTLTVALGAVAQSDPELEAAVETYRAYVKTQVEGLAAGAKALRDAIAAGDVETAKQQYILARPFYERIEPVAESFGDLDPAIDERADDRPADQIGGFHRIEYGLWKQTSTAGLLPVADQLILDVQRLQSKLPALEMDTLEIANGAVDLLGEVTSSKVTGEEERYSHIDLVDFQGNVDGARAAFDAVKPALAKRDASLASTVDKRFADVYAALTAYKKANAYVTYTDLTASDTKKLGQVIDALGEPLSQIPDALNQTPK